ncbi:Protein CBG13583 [Caenorhabditis briggsae]|uniref:Protein CBG13583 n=1 Tax=Caenorhabditis briggsae TaxID=6238 RepID=A8XI87_CAEBR|nr:Protein CBG13583 [Caenorhabditis briggsae]CAP32361.2 Protein CBG13583 [Caenorhabditis briggsae]
MDLLNATMASTIGDTSIEPSSVNGTVEDYCHYEVMQQHMLVMRFWMVSVFGSSISFISMVENVFLFLLFVTSRRHRRENLFMMLLAFFDIFVSMAYIMLMSVNVLSDVLMSPLLVSIWYTYMIPILTISHIAMTSSSFLIVAASFERYCATLNTPYLRFAQRNRKFIALCAVFLGVISKGTISIEFELVNHEQCVGKMMATTMKFRPFVFDTHYNYLFRFWYRHFVTVFAPFFILLYLNIRIVRALTTYTTATVCLVTNGNSEDLQKRKASARAATRTLVMVGCCYIFSNIINVILTSLEQTNNELGIDYPDLYIVLIDLVSLLTTMACAARLPIYLYCQPVLRREIFMHFKRLCAPCNPSTSEKLGERLKSMETDTSFLSKGDVKPSEGIPTTTFNEMKPPSCLHSPYETLL